MIPPRALICGPAGIVVLLVRVALAPAAAPQPATAPGGLPSLQEAIAANADLWAEAALRQPDGASYEFFKDRLPPLRYVNAAFRHYPIVLAAPRSVPKARLVSNGSALNAKADKKMWRDVGVPVSFFVGPEAEPFGADLARLDGPHYERGYLPIVKLAYAAGNLKYTQEAFASTDPELSRDGTALVQFSVHGGGGVVRARMDHPGPAARDGTIRDQQGRVLLLFGGGWRWDAADSTLVTELSDGASATLAMLTVPAADAPGGEFRYAQQRETCIATWEALLAKGVRLETPEPVVNNAWRALVIGDFMVARGDWLCYSAGNLYDHLYESECGEANYSLLLFGFLEDGRDFLGPLLDFQRQATRYHVAGLKLQNLANYYWLTRDAEYVRARRPAWQQAADLIIKDREPASGLVPRANYCGDINQQVYSLSSNALAWRGLRDLAAVLRDMNARREASTEAKPQAEELALADQLAREAGEYRRSILKAVKKSEYRDTTPPFIPMALFGEEKPYDRLPATRLGSYYDLIVSYVIDSNVFGRGSEREQWLIDYLRQHGGLFAGLIRCEPHQGEFAEEPGVNPLYGYRYTLKMLERDERERALVSYYAHLAIGLTPETFIGAEGERLRHGDEFGRSFYLPPNTACNAFSLITLRYLLIQDWDLDDDGRPETLRLLYGVPRRWLADGKSFAIQDAPTAFGKVSLEVRSRLAEGAVSVRVTCPRFAPKQMLLRVPLPTGWRVVSASIEPPRPPLNKGGSGRVLGPDGAVDLTGRTGELTIRFKVEASRP